MTHVDVGRQFRSNPSTCGPSGAIQLVLKASSTNAVSSSPKWGGESQMRCESSRLVDEIHRQALIVHDRNMGNAVLAEELLDLRRGRGLPHYQRSLSWQLIQRASAGGLLQQGPPEVAVGDRARKLAGQVNRQQYALGGLVHACHCFDPGHCKRHQQLLELFGSHSQ